MERIYANLYRIGGTPNSRGLSYSYLLQRKAGNLLVCHQSGPTDEDLAEIEALGGIDSQWICHQHDALKGGQHEALHERFGCLLHHHETDRKPLRRKTKCPTEQFGDDELPFAPDFEAIFLPTCTAGHSIFRWRNRGKYYLFTSHAIYRHGDEWDLTFNPRIDELWRPQLKRLAGLRVDFVFPGYVAVDDDAFYRLDAPSQKAFARALTDKAKAAA